MIFLNGPPSSFINNDKILIHALQDLYGINYINKFYRKLTQFGKVMSKVEQQIHDRTHDPARNVASSRILPYLYKPDSNPRVSSSVSWVPSCQYSKYICNKYKYKYTACIDYGFQFQLKI